MAVQIRKQSSHFNLHEVGKNVKISSHNEYYLENLEEKLWRMNILFSLRNIADNKLFGNIL